MAVGALALLAVGCNKSTSSGAARRGPTAVSDAAGDELVQSFADNLNHLDEFEANQILPQLRDRLNQWVLQQKPSVSWEPDPLVDTLPDEYRHVRPLERLDSERYIDADMLSLREAVWLRDVARSARGNELDDLSVATSLFDWTVRNIQLEPPGGEELPPHRTAGEILMLGRGTARDRAWVFILLLRQLGLDAVMLAIPQSPTDLREWVPALIADNDLYLFAPNLGLPIPGPGGRGVATLAQVAADDGLLRQVDVSSQRRYPVEAAELKDLVAFVEASPSYLERRMKLVESRLTGQNKITLTASPSQIAQRLAKQSLISQVRVWPLPYEVLQTRATKHELLRGKQADLLVFEVVPSLAQARALAFKGQFDGEKGAKAFYLRSRPSQENLARTNMHPAEKAFWEVAKQDASYWLGLIAFEQKNYPAAINAFTHRTLEVNAASPWTDGAHYNLARTYEAAGETNKAIELYQSDSSPQKNGNRLRARRLKAEHAAAADEQAAAQTEAPATTAAETPATAQSP